MLDKNKKYLITCRRFTAPDGLEYDSVWGKAEIVKAEDVIGFPNERARQQFRCKGYGRNKNTFHSWLRF